MAAFTGNGYLVANIAALLAIGASDRPAFKVAILVAGLGWYEYDNSAVVGGLRPADNPSTGRWFSVNVPKQTTGGELLQSNKNYVAVNNDGNPVWYLPSTPSVGDVITLTAAITSLKVFHGNSTDRILNNSTLSVAGVNSGIILSPYASISLIYSAQNLWVSGFKARTTNNWADTAEEVTSTLKTYTPTELETYFYASGQPLSRINDGNKTNQGVLKAGSPSPGEFKILLTFNTPIRLTGIDFWLGQFNGAFNFPTSVDIYRGGTVGLNFINTTSFSTQNGTISLDSGSSYSTTFALNFKGGAEISVLEIETFGKQVIGGEITV